MAGQSRTLKLAILGDVDQLKKSLNTGSTEVNGFASKLGDFSKKAGLAFAAAGAAATAYAGKLLVDGVKAAIEDEAAQAKLATTLRNVTNATDDQIAAIESQITKTALLTGKTDDELRPSFARLIRSTKDAAEAAKLQALALDISAGGTVSLEAASNALAKAHDGNFAALNKLGGGIDASIIKSKDFDAATAALAKTFEGAASKQAETFEGKMLRLNVAFDEAKETVGSYVLDALTPLVSGFVDKGIPAIQDFASNLGKTLGPAFEQIFKVIRDDVLPIIKAWYGFIVDTIIPAITAIVKPAFEGLVSAFDTIKNAVSDNSAELKPLLGFFKSIAEFVKDELAPILGGAFKLALQAIGNIVAGLVTGFSRLVGFITQTITKIKEFVEFVKNNPVTRFFFGDSGGKSLKASGDFEMGAGDAENAGFAIPGTQMATGYSPAMQAAILRREQLKAETERLRVARDAAAAARTAATGGLTTAERITINVNAPTVIDQEGFSRAVTDALNNSYYRGTLGAGALAI
jgi:hypothetical protein